MCAGAITKQHQLFFNPISFPFLHGRSNVLVQAAPAILLDAARSPRIAGSRPSSRCSALATTRRARLQLSAFDRRTLLNSGPRDRSLDIVLSPPPSPSRSPPSDVRFSPAPPAGSPRPPPHTRPSALRGKIQSLPAHMRTRDHTNESVPRCAATLLHFPPRHRCFDDRSAHTARTLRKRCTTADSNSVHSSHGRIALPASRAEDRR